MNYGASYKTSFKANDKKPLMKGPNLLPPSNCNKSAAAVKLQNRRQKLGGDESASISSSAQLPFHKQQTENILIEPQFSETNQHYPNHAPLSQQTSLMP